MPGRWLDRSDHHHGPSEFNLFPPATGSTTTTASFSRRLTPPSPPLGGDLFFIAPEAATGTRGFNVRPKSEMTHNRIGCECEVFSVWKSRSGAAQITGSGVLLTRTRLNPKPLDTWADS